MKSLVAENGALGLELLKSTHPDIALVDIGLPGMDGYEIARRFRAEPNGDGRASSLRSPGTGQSTDRDRSRQAGFDLHLLKPVDPRSPAVGSGRTRMITRRELRARIGAALDSLRLPPGAVFLRLLPSPSGGCSTRGLATTSRSSRSMAPLRPRSGSAGTAQDVAGGHRRLSGMRLPLYRAARHLRVRGLLVVRRGAGLRGDVRRSSSGSGMPRTKARHKAHGHGELLRTTLASIGDAVVTTDLSGRVTSMNPSQKRSSAGRSVMPRANC